MFFFKKDGIPAALALKPAHKKGTFRVQNNRNKRHGSGAPATSAKRR